MLDPQTKNFYIEMGYTQQQVLRASEYSKKNKIDILDALSMNLPSSQPQGQSNPKHQNTSITGNKTQQLDKYSLLIPFSKVKGSQYEVLYSRSSKQNQLNSKYQLREVNTPVGLLNISNCCYLNSLLQCYFLMNDFKVALLSAEPLQNLDDILGSQSKTKLKRIKNQYELLKKLKNFFTLMFLTSKKYLDPSQVLQNLVDSVGQKISYGQEKDLSEINIMIIQRLSEGLTYSQKYYKEEVSFAAEDQSVNGSIIIESQKKAKFNSMFNPKEGVIKRLFYGTKVQYYQDTNNIQKEPPIVSDFTGIILNPHFGTLSHALDQQFNFSVQINGSTFNKQIFIRDEPQYLFMYINRTNFDRQQGQMLKNEQKFTFDFVIYMDRYLQKYRKQKDMKNERVKELTVNKNKIKEQMDDLQILFKKMEECYRYVAKLEGWAERLPKQQEFNEQYAKLDAKLNQIQTELKQIQSRKQQYHLMYIFVHRGDAASGHYWGYGRNDDKWYRFDINCRKIDQQQIIIDMDKSSATPYALLYVKQKNIPKFDYQHHMTKFSYQNKNQTVDFRSCFDHKLSEEIVRENMLIHQQILVRSNQAIKKKVYVDYVNRFNAVKKVSKRYREDSQGKMGQLDIYNNFSLFLYFRKEYQLCNFSIFEQSLLLASNNKITIDKLIHESDLLSRIQKKFKKRCRGQYYLKHYALLSEQRQRYGQLLQAYHLSVFQMIWGIGLMFEYQSLGSLWQNSNIKYSQSQKLNANAILKNKFQNIFRLYQIRGNLIKSEEWKRANQILNDPLYITQVNQEVTKLILLKMAVWGIKIQSVQQFIDFNDVFSSQIVIINAANTLQVERNDSNIPKVSPIASAIQFINNFYLRAGKFSSSEISTQPPKQLRSSVKLQTSSQKQLLSTPTKTSSNSRQSLSMNKRVSQSKLSYPADIRPVLAVKQSWRLEQLDKIQINYGYSDRLMVFLKQMTNILAVYKKILNLNKAFTLVQLRKEIQLNQSEEQQSLI